jgi:hypothetical protein
LAFASLFKKATAAMKKQVLLLLILIFPLFTAARPFQVGIKGGLNFSTLPSDILATANGERLTILSDTYSGYHLGVAASLTAMGFFFQPELLYVSTGRDMYMQVNGPVHEDDYYLLKYQHLSMPLLAGIKLGPLRLGAGPVFSLLLNHSDTSTIQVEQRMHLQDATVGFQLGAGIKFGGLLLDLRYEGSLTGMGDGVTIMGKHLDFDLRPRQTILSIGLLF